MFIVRHKVSGRFYRKWKRNWFKERWVDDPSEATTFYTISSIKNSALGIRNQDPETHQWHHTIDESSLEIIEIKISIGSTAQEGES